MARNILFSAAVVLIVLSLFLPWFTMNYTSNSAIRDGYYEEGGAVKTETEFSLSYYLDHGLFKQKTEITKGDNSERTYGGSNNHYSENLESGDSLGSTESLLYSLYKIIMVVLFLSFVIVVLEGFGQETDLSSIKIGIALLNLVVILLFISSIKASFLEDNGDEVILESSESNEYVNMSSSFGFGKSLVSNDTHIEYYALADSSSFGFEKTIVTTRDYDSTWQSSYFVLYSGPSPDEIDWNKNNYNHSYNYENETSYYVWFDKEALDANVSDRNPTLLGDEFKSIRVDINDLSENNNSDVVIRNRIVQAVDSSGYPFTALGNQTELDRLSIESTYYGNQRNAQDSYSGNVFTTVDGFLDYTEVRADTKLGASWHPSSGFIVSILGFVCFVGSRFEDS